MNVTNTERKIVEKLYTSPRTTNNLEKIIDGLQYQGIYKACRSLEDKGILRRTSETRNFDWELTQEGLDLVKEKDKVRKKDNNNMFPVYRDYDHQDMVPSDAHDFIDINHLIEKIETTMFSSGGVFVFGDTGMGKTQLVQNIAMKNDYPMYRIQGVPGVRTEDLIGFPVQMGEDTIWVDGVIPKVLLCSQERKCVLFVDEVNRLRTEVQSVFYPILDGRCTCVIHERGGEVIKGKEENLAFIATANIGTEHYVNPFDRAFEDRFSIYRVDYLSSAAEVRLLQERTGIYKDLCIEMVDAVNDIRKLYKSREDPISKPVSTRRLLKWGKTAVMFNEISRDPIIDSARATIINHYDGDDRDSVRQIIEHLQGVSLDEKEEEKKREEFEARDDEQELNDILDSYGKKKDDKDEQ